MRTIEDFNPGMYGTGYITDLKKATALAEDRLAQGCSWHVATEEAAEEFSVSLCDVQELVPAK